MGTAIIGLVGVVVGAVVTGALDWLMTRREDRTQLRVALRLVCTDLHKAIAVTAPVARSGAWGPERDSLVPHAYEKHAGALARSLAPASWKKLEGAVLGMQRLDSIRRAMFEDDREASSDEMADIVRIRTFITSTLNDLETELRALGPSSPPPDG